MGFLSKLFKRPTNESIILQDYDRAMKSYHLEFIQQVINRYGMEIGDNDDYRQLQQRLFRLQKRRKVK